MRSAEGRIEGVLIDAFMVTEQVIARQEVGRLRAQAEAANRMKDEFLALLGHELRNPLAPMVAARQLAGAGPSRSWSSLVPDGRSEQR